MTVKFKHNLFFKNNFFVKFINYNILYQLSNFIDSKILILLIVSSQSIEIVTNLLIRLRNRKGLANILIQKILEINNFINKIYSDNLKINYYIKILN